MKNRSRFLALALAVSVVAANIALPAYDAEAAADMGQISQQDIYADTYGETAGVVEVAELPDEDGDYVVYMESDRTDEVSFTDEAYEINTDSPAVILETDLSAAQLDQLEELSGQEEEVYVEENIFLTGASGSIDLDETDIEENDLESTDIEGTDIEKNNIQETDAGEISEEDTSEEDADLAERLALKKVLAEQFLMEEKTEAEWNIQMIHADDVDAGEAVGTPVKVAVLDSGVEFLAGIPIEKSINFVKDEQDLPYYMNDMTGHGTAVADIIHQVCPQARIYSVKVMDSENRGRLSDVVAGIYWCMEQDVDIINMSFGTSVESDILRKAIQEAAEQGIMMVSSAGNGGTGSAVEYPAAFGEVIAVGAVDTSAQKTEESTTGEEVELAAPGEQILTKSMLGLETVNSGTSVAAPHVTGAAALLMQQSESKDAAFIRKVLDKSSNPLGDENAYGYGLVDVAYAVEILDNYHEIVMEESVGEGTFSGISSGFELWKDNLYPETACDGDIRATDMPEVTLGEVERNMSEKSEIETESEKESVSEQEKDVPDALEQISRPVETFGEVDYVEGRWHTKDHESLGEELCRELGVFTKVELEIFRKGAGFPDKEESRLDRGSIHPEWHGWISDNYIANFIFATKIAKAGGDTANLKMVKGQSLPAYVRMTMSITLEGIADQKWKDILGEWNYSDQSEKKQRRWRQIFLYGMAFHTATDAFAHSSYYKDTATGKIIRFHSKDTGLEPQRDDKNSYTNRWKCAGNTGKWIVEECYYEMTGDISDFSSCGKKYWKGFYMGNILDYAIEANGESDPYLVESFQSMNYSDPKYSNRN